MDKDDMRKAIDQTAREGAEAIIAITERGAQPIDIFKAAFAMLDGLASATRNIPGAERMYEDIEQATGTVLLLIRRIADGSVQLGVVMSEEEAIRKIAAVQAQRNRPMPDAVAFMPLDGRKPGGH